MSKTAGKPVRSGGERQFFTDPTRKALGKYHVDECGRQVFRNDRGEPYYFGEINGELHPIIICPSFVPVFRKPVEFAGGVSLGNGCFRRGLSISNF